MSASFDSYKIFYHVGKYGNITHAASALFLSQSTVSRCIQSLESELGCKLFERFQHGVILTVEGEMLYNQIANACEQIILGEKKLRQIQLFGEGNIRFGVNDFTYHQYIVPVLKEFRKDFPAVKAEISLQTHESQNSIFADIASGRLDFACTVFPLPASGDFLITNIAEFKDILIAGHDYSELRGKCYNLSDLTAYPFVSLAGNLSGSAYLEQAFAMRGLSILPALKVDTLTSLIPLVGNGLGLAIIPEPYYLRLKASEGVFKVNLFDALPQRSVCIVTSKNHPRSSAREELIRRIKKNIQQQMGLT